MDADAYAVVLVLCAQTGSGKTRLGRERILKLHANGASSGGYVRSVAMKRGGGLTRAWARPYRRVRP
jgi:hypothetical protein